MKVITENRTRRPWERHEFILVLNQYMKMPFGKMHSKNADIAALANLLGRTPGSVAMRLVNFASCDPILAERNIKGLSGGKDQCMPYWEEFCHDRESLMYESEQILAQLQNTTIEKKFHHILDVNTELKGESIERVIKTRVNQEVFRQMILSVYDNRCAITGINEKDLLLASHIKPWSVDVENRLNPQNGLCLSALYDRAFDKGLISFDERYRVILSQRLKQHCTEDYFEQYFGSIEGKVLNIPFEDYKPNQLFLEYHRDCILQR